jgi:pSer/pThr/pTyr-binding forkhead associated (FHA) protein
MFFLLVRDSESENVVRLEARSGIEIGRSPDSQCVLSDPNVGRKAAKLVEERGELFVEDMGSTNRTSIRGGRKLAKGERERLRHGLVIEVGRSSIEIEEVRPVPDDKTDHGDATNPAQDQDDMGAATIVAGALDDRTLPGTPPPPPKPAPPVRVQRAPAPAPVAKRAEPVVLPPLVARPAPEVAPAPSPVPQEEAPEPSRASDLFSSGGLGGGTQSIRPVTGDLGALGALITRRPRLVIVNEADRRVVPIEEMEVTIGRESGPCRIDHKAISEPHATIRFVAATNNFQIQDRKSRNQTFVGGLALNPEQPQLLAPECLVRFGPIEAVFVVDRDSENVEIPAVRYAGAVRWLVAQNQITPVQAKAAQDEAKPGGKHVGEALMMAGVVNARAWNKAFESGSNLVPPSAAFSGGRRTFGVIAIVIVLIALALFWIFRG